MGREIDLRNRLATRLTEARRQDLHAKAADISNAMPVNQAIAIESFSHETGNPSKIVATGQTPTKDQYIKRALDYVQDIGPALGFAPTQATEYVPDPNVQKTSTGATAVYLQQHYKGIPIFQAAQTVRFSPNDTLTDTVGDTITVDQPLPVAPRLSVQEAVLKAAQHVAEPTPDEMGEKDQFGEAMDHPKVDVQGFQPKVTAMFASRADHPCVLEAGPFGSEFKANLIWFPAATGLLLGWEIIVTMPGYEGQFRTIVDADNGEILYCKDLVKSLFRANVVFPDGSTPRQMKTLPIPLADLTLPAPPPGSLPNGFPDPWVASDRTIGNCVRAHLGVNGPSFQGLPQGGDVVFDPASPTGDEQKVLNIFYLNCFIHDFFYLLHFREADGNFQTDKFGRGGIGGDPVDARAHSGVVRGTANMITPVEGTNPIMNMGLVSSTNRHTAFDASVVFHEFTHGVTNRLVAGPQNTSALEAPQSIGMGEGWGDYIACTILKKDVVGDWVVGRAQGIRGFPYDSAFPDHFGKLGAGRYAADPNSGQPRDEHNVGEIWCATLREMNRNIGDSLGLQLVVDALKLAPPNPSFLEMRDSILTALDNQLVAGKLSPPEHDAARVGVWKAFAKFGMGPAAQSNGSQLNGIVADFQTP
ncbi:M36 family metallopeptidase [Paludisphaera rhizosphaerae]|uniref:M36 family metallopeptidase n=1 Tax=Paludisphaera rhizosphaerae TaxID=2711216 RepID=UPI0013EC58CE|nr:M36 family metallopeptidase [Paludisphaera rhizosphaerae]